MNGMSGRRRVIQRLFLFLILLPGLFWRPAPVAAAGSSSGIPLVTALIYSQIHNLTKIFRNDITRTLGYCIKDVDTDLNEAFNFTNLDFMNDCVKESKDVTQRLCTAAEMKFYFSSFLESKSDVAQFLPPNNNCNLSSWTSGCEPGWACAVAGNTKSDLKNAKNIPDRTTSCQPCCAGFFCPRGLTCMIPCPLGSYCPRATLNKATGVCDPYRYQLPAGNPNHTCGGADMWAGVTSAEEIFCSSGSFCPTNTKEVRCTEGHYCRQGSTAEKACFKLSTCNPNTETQNLHGLGVLLIGALSFILFIFYNFSDQVITTKYQRLAKSREAAARSARETAQARERWKSAKDVAKKGAAGLTSSLSRTFSKKTGKPDPVLPPKAQPRSKKKGENNLTQMMQNIGDDPENPEGFDMAIGDRHIKKQKIKAKQLHTKSQIFKYAYGQLEKEKAMEQHTRDMTFSGIISMATDDEVRTRPTLEVDFKDLTLTLQGKNKHLLRCVTGKLQPGRISAVMGPSGAGKTTFLSAVLGRATGCTITGSILINGRPDSIQHYKKILGFVPQDDIVHGNLTVEENLRFSARCRLPADMPKPDKVLVVERVIDSLGLQGVRDSLVGTVEVRGISGGQKKRVNVGLELVMEPSLLILDEPTTGLDSSSSNLLLKALRREALEGVNISMVVHQPSYTLFNMFDDFILLAKGGLTVYHGPVKRVEEYFSGIGINVPDRVVPADYLIDILEGIEKLEGKLTVEQLPVRWMLHNGYTVPHDMMQYLDEIASSSKGGNTNPSGAPAQLTDAAFQAKLDNLPNSLMLFHRVTPGVSRQLRYYIGRVCKQRLREAKIQAVDYLILLLAGACLGTLSKVKGDTFGYRGYMYTVIAVSLLIKISALRSFTLDKLEYYRESGSGMSSLAYFLSKDTVDHFNTLIKPLVFLSMFYFFNNPRSTFTDNYIVLVCLVYCVTGMAYVFAIFLDPGPAQLWSVLLPVVLTLVANQDQEDRIGQLLANYCYPKWAMEAFVIANAQRYGGVWLITRCGTLLQLGYSLHDWTRCLVFLILAGIGCRILAFVLLVTFVKK